MSIQNPYSCTIPGNLFVGHKRLRRDLVNGIRQGNSYAIIAGRRCGKTSLLKQLEKDLKSGGPDGANLGHYDVVPVYLDIQSFSSININLLFERFYKLLIKALDAEPWDSPAEGKEYDCFLQLLKKHESALIDKYGDHWLAVYLIDELDSAIERLPDDQFFQNLRNLLMVSAFNRHFRVIASGVRGMGDLISSGSSPLNNLRHRYLKIFREKQVSELISKGFDKVAFDYELQTELIRITGGHPYLLQGVLEFLWRDYNDEEKELSVLLIKSAARRHLQEHSDFARWAKSFSDAEHALYGALAVNARGRMTIEDLDRSIDRKFWPQIDDALTILSYHGVIDDFDPDEPRIAGTLFRDWYVRHCVSIIDRNSLSNNGQCQERSNVFISYSHSDEKWLKRLQVHLKPLERCGVIEIWDDTKIEPGEEWRKEIEKALNAAKVAVLLVTADFLASDFIAENELPPLLEAAENDGAIIMPFIISPCTFELEESINKFQAINNPKKPVADLEESKQEWGFVDVVRAIKKALDSDG